MYIWADFVMLGIPSVKEGKRGVPPDTLSKFFNLT